MKKNSEGPTAKRKSPLEWKLQGRISTQMKDRMELIVDFMGIEETEFVRYAITSLLDSYEKNPMFRAWLAYEKGMKIPVLVQPVEMKDFRKNQEPS